MIFADNLTEAAPISPMTVHHTDLADNGASEHRLVVHPGATLSGSRVVEHDRPVPACQFLRRVAVIVKVVHVALAILGFTISTLLYRTSSKYTILVGGINKYILHQ